LEVSWATIILAIEGIFAYPQSRDFSVGRAVISLPGIDDKEEDNGL